jgi:hypothetical protein
MDITDFQPHEREVELFAPNGQRTGIWFHLRPPDAPEIKAVERKLDDAVLRFRGRLPAAERKKFRENRLVAGVAGWHFDDGAMTVNGEEKPKFSEARLRKLLQIEWIAKFLDTEMGDENAFFEKLDNA